MCACVGGISKESNIRYERIIATRGEKQRKVFGKQKQKQKKKKEKEKRICLVDYLG